MKINVTVINWKWLLPIPIICFLLLAQYLSMIIVTQHDVFPINIKLADSLRTVNEKELKTLNSKLDKLKPKSPYLVINSTANEFYLYDGNQLLKHGKCSTGSYVLLKNADLQEWMFKTPKGAYKILGKTKNPVWKKPDWAFVEEGQKVPPINDPSRFEYGVLGDYSLSLGDGYLIHGTLYQRFIGLPVTHGCIRLNDDNLALVYKNLSTGSKVYLF